MRFERRLDDGTEIAWGHDHAVQFFLAVHRPGRRALAYDALTPGYDHLRGLIAFMVTAKVVSEDDRDDGLAIFDDSFEGEPSPGARLVVHVLQALKGEF